MPADIVNVNGGAIAIGHPIGMSGARITLHLALELQRRGGGIGAAALCGGGGQGDALIVRVPPARGCELGRHEPCGLIGGFRASVSRSARPTSPNSWSGPGRPIRVRSPG